jgi:hypothetical protein
MSHLDDFNVAMEETWQKMQAKDKAAKETGSLVGRYIQEPIADGHAYYMIVAEYSLEDSPYNNLCIRWIGTNNTKASWCVERNEKDFVIVGHIPYGDAWTVPMIESLNGRIPRKYAKENIERRERIEALFAN